MPKNAKVAAHGEPDYSLSPDGERFPLPRPDEYAPEHRRVERRGGAVVDAQLVDVDAALGHAAPGEQSEQDQQDDQVKDVDGRLPRDVQAPGDGSRHGVEEIGDDVGERDATVEGADSKIAFNGKYLTDVLGVLKETQVTLETTNPSSPGIIRPVGNDKYVHVVMPMFVQW